MVSGRSAGHPCPGRNDNRKKYQHAWSEALPDAGIDESVYSFDVFFTAFAEEKSSFQQTDNDAKHRSGVCPNGLGVYGISIFDQCAAFG